jgi:hypothetical protein
VIGHRWMTARRAVLTSALAVTATAAIVTAVTMAWARTGSGGAAAPALAFDGARAASDGTAATKWRLELAISPVHGATTHTEFDTVIVEAGRAWFLGGSDVGGHGYPLGWSLHDGHQEPAGFSTFVPGWITAASATSPTNMWAVTNLGSVYQWDAASSTWVVAPGGNWALGTRFTGITALSPTDVWVFGTNGTRYPGAGTWQWTGPGSGWTGVTGAASAVYQASAATASDIWGIGGSHGFNRTLLHYDGSSWRRVRPGALAGFRYTHVLAFGGKNVWLAGSVGGSPRLAHYNGRAWTSLPMPGSTAATGICRDGHGGIFVVANSGHGTSIVRDRSASGTWRPTSVSSSPANEVLACALDARSGAVWGAGKAAAPKASAAAGYRYG